MKLEAHPTILSSSKRSGETHFYLQDDCPFGWSVRVSPEISTAIEDIAHFFSLIYHNNATFVMIPQAQTRASRARQALDYSSAEHARGLWKSF